MSNVTKVTNLNSAYRKLKQFANTKQWCGCLTPSEMLVLLEDGGKEANNPLYEKEYIKEQVKKGDSRPNWFYFYPNKKQLQRLL